MLLQATGNLLRPGFVVLLLLAIAAGVAPSHAGAPASTLERIAQTGVIRVGYGNTPPFSYTDTDGTIIGYSIDLCKKVAEELRAGLGLPHIDIEYVERTPSNRVQLLNDGMMDIECNASTNNAERRRSVAFAESHFYVTTHYVSLARNNLDSLDDLNGRSVSVVLGTVNVGHINQANRERKLNLSLVTADSLQAAFDMVTQERVFAFAMDDVLLSAMIAATPNPDDYAISQEALTEPEPYGFMMRLEDKKFADAVNAALRKIYEGPDMAAIYDRWFNQPIPRENINLRIPMSASLKQAFRGKEEAKAPDSP